jgi:hypothetical protein
VLIVAARERRGDFDEKRRVLKRAKRSSEGQPDWRAFELLVAAIEERMGPKGAIVKSPDRVRDLDSKRLREVDASIRLSAGSIEILVTVECRKRKGIGDVTWIEQLATKRNKIGASKTIAVSSSGFSAAARASATRYGIELRVLGEVLDADVDAWFAPESFVHMYRLIESLVCRTRLSSGSTEEFDGMEARFRHPSVNGLFPGAIFVSFLEMKEPEVLWGVPIAGKAHKVAFEFNGRDPNLIPVPLGVQKKSDVLEILVNGEYYVVESLTLEMLVSYNAETLKPEDGRHYVYGSPDAPVSALSHFNSEMFGLSVQINRFTKMESTTSATVSFPSGLTMTADVVRPRLTDMTKVDIEMLQRLPVTIKIRGGGFADGMFLNPFSAFEDEALSAEFNTDNFLFLLAEDFEKIMAIEHSGSLRKLFSDLVKVLPRAAVEHIDLTPAMSALARKER